MQITLPSPLEKIDHDDLSERNISLLIKRDDLIHPQISGNKWRKLQGYISEISEQPKHIISFGGAYSNHLHALAHLCQFKGIKLTAIVRGEAEYASNATLANCPNTEFIFVDRQTYRQRNQADYLKALQVRYPNSLIMQEGGLGQAGLVGFQQLCEEVEQNFDLLCTPVGSGTTLAGLSKALPNKYLLGFCAIKGGEYLYQEIANLLDSTPANIELATQYHFGGFGKVTEELLAFILNFYQQHNILLDPVYTGKAMFGLFDLIKTGKITGSKKIVFLHTGGLQGWFGMLERGLIDKNYAKQLGLFKKL